MKRREFITLLWLLMILQPTPVWAQEDHVVTAQLPQVVGEMLALHLSGRLTTFVQGWFNVTRVICECTQSEAPGRQTWECVATATCKK